MSHIAPKAKGTSRGKIASSSRLSESVFFNMGNRGRNMWRMPSGFTTSRHSQRLACHPISSSSVANLSSPTLERLPRNRQRMSTAANSSARWYKRSSTSIKRPTRTPTNNANRTLRHTIERRSTFPLQKATVFGKKTSSTTKSNQSSSALPVLSPALVAHRESAARRTSSDEETDQRVAKTTSNSSGSTPYLKKT